MRGASGGLSRRLLWAAFWIGMGLVFAAREAVLAPGSLREARAVTHLLFCFSVVFLLWGAICVPLEAVRRRFPLDGTRRSCLYLHAGLSVVVVSLHLLVSDLLLEAISPFLFPAYHSPGDIAVNFGVSFHWDLIEYWIILLALEARAQHAAATRGDTRASELRRQLGEARLASLRAQLDPHFLFNTLNSISELLDLEPAAAGRMIDRLSSLVRRNADTRELAANPLAAELDSVRQYLEVEQTRFGERLRLGIEVDPDLLDAPVPTLLLQPLVENAVRHGVARLERGALVSLTVVRSSAGLVIELVNNFQARATPTTRPGVGIANCRARLAALYGADASLAAGPSADGSRYVVRIEMPASLPPSGALETPVELELAGARG